MSYKIVGKYGGLAPEEIDTADTLEEATDLLDEYRTAFGGGWELWVEAVVRSNPYCRCRSNPRLANIEYSSGRSKPEHCKICGVATRESKDLCSLHIEQRPYVQRLAGKMERMAEEETLANKGKVSLASDSETVKELMVLLELNGPRTIDRLARELNKTKKAIAAYVAALKKKGLVTTSLNKRGSTVVALA